MAAEIAESTYNDANELVAQTVGGVTTEYAYDDWGRLISKWQGDGTTVHAEYLWRYGSYLKRVDTTFPGEETVAYQVDGLGHRRLKALDPDTYDQDNFTWYRWAGMAVLSEYEDSGTVSSTGIGTRQRGYVGGLAQIAGSNPATGTYQYMTHDHLGSVRGIYSGAKSELGAYDYMPYGTPQTTSGLPLNKGFTGHQWDAELGQYYAPFRYYNPGMGRWLGHEPLGYLGGPNLYQYGLSNPAMYVDPDGRLVFLPGLIGGIIGGLAGGINAWACGRDPLAGAAIGAAAGAVSAYAGPFGGALVNMAANVTTQWAYNEPITGRGLVVAGVTGFAGGFGGWVLANPAKKFRPWIIEQVPGPEEFGPAFEVYAVVKNFRYPKPVRGVIGGAASAIGTGGLDTLTNDCP